MNNQIHPQFYAQAAREYEEQIGSGIKVKWESSTGLWRVTIGNSTQLLTPALSQRLDERAAELAVMSLPKPQSQAQKDAKEVHDWNKRKNPRKETGASFDWDNSTGTWSQTDDTGKTRNYKRNDEGEWMERTWNKGSEKWDRRRLDMNDHKDIDRVRGLDRLDQLTEDAQRGGANWTEKTGSWWKSLLSSEGVGGSLGAHFVKNFASLAPEAAIASTWKSVKEGAESGGQIVDSIVGGIRSNINHITKAAEMIVDAITRPLFSVGGRSGNALSSLLGNAMNAGKFVLDKGADVATGALKLGAGAVGAGVAIGGGIAGAGIGAVAGAGVGAAPGWMVGMAAGAAVGAIVMKVLEEIAEKIGGVLKGLGEVFGEFGKQAAGVISSVIEIIQDAVQTAQRQAQALMNIKLGGGYTGEGASSLLNSFRTFGVSPEQTAGIFQNTNSLYMGSKTAMWGVKGINMDGSANGDTFLSSLRERYQGMMRDYGPQIGTMLARTMLSSLGMDSPEMRNAMTMNGKRFSQAQEFGKGLGLDPDAAKKWVEDFGTLQNEISQFVDFIKIQLGNALLPSLQKGLEMAVKYFKSHQKEIIDSLWRIGEYIYVDFPLLLMKGARVILGIIKSTLEWFDGFQKATANAGQSPILDILQTFLKGIDMVVETFKQGSAVMHLFGMVVLEVFNALPKAINTVLGLLLKLPTAVAKLLGIDLGGLAPFLKQSQQTAQQMGYTAQTLKQFGPAIKAVTGNGVFGTGMSTAFTNWRASLTPVVGNTQSGQWAASIGQQIKTLDANIKSYDADGRRKDFQDLRTTLSDLHETLKNGITVKVEQKISLNSTEDFLAKVVNYSSLATWRKMDMAVGGA